MSVVVLVVQAGYSFVIRARRNLRGALDGIEVRKQGHRHPVVVCDSLVAGDHRAKFARRAAA
jgi:hypothetical protein